MPTAMPRAITLLSVTTDPATKNVVLLVKAEDQSSYEIPIHPGIVGVVATALLGHGSAIGRDDPNGLGTVMQSMQLNAIRGGIRPDGRLVLGLILENGLHLPVTFPLEAVRNLQAVLADLGEATVASGTRPKQRH